MTFNAKNFIDPERDITHQEADHFQFGQKKVSLNDILQAFRKTGYEEDLTSKEEALQYLANFADTNKTNLGNDIAQKAVERNIRLAKSKSYPAASTQHNQLIEEFCNNLVTLNEGLMAGRIKATSIKVPAATAKPVLAATAVAPTEAAPSTVYTTRQEENEEEMFDILLRTSKDASHAKYIGDKRADNTVYGVASTYETAEDAMVACLKRLAKSTTEQELTTEGIEKRITPTEREVNNAKTDIHKALDVAERLQLNEILFGDPAADGYKVQLSETDARTTAKVKKIDDQDIYTIIATKGKNDRWEKIEWKIDLPLKDITVDYKARHRAILGQIGLAVKTMKESAEPRLNLIITDDSPENLVIKAFAAANLGVNPCFENAAVKTKFQNYMDRTLPGLLRTHSTNPQLNNIYTDLLAQATAVKKFKDIAKGDTIWDPCSDIISRANITQAEQATIDYQEAFYNKIIANTKIPQEQRDAISSRLEMTKQQHNTRLTDATSIGSRVVHEAFGVRPMTPRKINRRSFGNGDV